MLEINSQDDDMSDNKNSSFVYNVTKRLLDIVGGFLGFIITSPIMLVFLILIKLETPGKAIYTQNRLGKDGKEFLLYKLRSMNADAEAGGAQWANKEDIRVTKIGRFIRLTRIDELPQLLNVLRGDMSIVGPRPERPIFVKQFIKTTPGFEKRMTVKPGLTGWAQVNGGYDLTPEMKLVYDLYYIKNKSIGFDFKILLRTVKVILTGQGAR